MLLSGSKMDVYECFQQMQGWSRMDFLCNLIHLCNPFELRFIGACIEDMAQTDCKTLRDQEVKANSIENLEQFISKCPPVDEFRSHISVCLALLQSSNYKVATKLAAVLDEKLDDLNLEHLMQAGLDAEVEQWMLMLTLAAYHPAFKFENKFKFKRQLSEYGVMNKKGRKATWCRTSHRYSLPQHTTEDCDDIGWTTEMGRDPVSFQTHSGYPDHARICMDCNPGPYQGKPYHGNLPEGVRHQSVRPSTLPPCLAPLGNGDAVTVEKPFGRSYTQNSNVPRCNIHSPRGERTSCFNGGHRPLQSSAQNFSNIVSNQPSAVECYSPERSTSLQPTVSQPHTCSNAASMLTTILTTTVSMKATKTHSTRSTREYLLWGSGYNMASSAKSRKQHSPVPATTNSERTSNRYHCETQTQRSKNRNRSQSGDTNSGKQPSKKSHENVQSSESLPHRLRICTSAPMLAIAREDQMESCLELKEEKRQRLRNETISPCLPTQNLKPVNVFVNIIPEVKKGNSKPNGVTRFNLKVEWSDGAMSECDRSVDEMVTFYKKITGRIGKNALNNVDFLTKQNNQIVERREKLEGIFREIVSSTVNDSNVKQFMTFFEYKPTETPTASSLPLKKRKFRTGSMSRTVLDESGSSSSTTSPPLVDDNSRRLASPKNHTPESSLSPISAKEGTSSSALSSPTTKALISQMTSGGNEPPNCHDNDTRNDAYLKLFYWLKERNLTEIYTHVKKYTFEEFFNLHSSEINKLESLSAKDKETLNEEIAKMRREMPVNDCDTALGIDMGMLSLSPNREVSKKKDIESTLDDVAHTASEDEKSGSSRSAPVPFEIPNSDDIQAIASSSCFSFVFDSCSATADSSARYQRSNHRSNDDTDLDLISQAESPHLESLEYYNASDNRPNGPGQTWSQTDLRPSLGYPAATVSPVYLQRSAPPLPTHMAYFSRTYQTDQANAGPIVMRYIPSAGPVTFHTPISTTSSVSMTQQSIFTQAPIVTVPSPMGQKPLQYSYNVANPPQARTVYPSSFCPAHSVTSPVGEGINTAPVIYVNEMSSPQYEVENSPPSNILAYTDSNERGSPESSDPDSLSKPLSTNVGDGTVANRRGPSIPNYYWKPAPIQYNVCPQNQWAPPMHHHPLAPSYSDPTSFTPRTDSGEYLPPMVTSGSIISNGYSDVRNSYSMPAVGWSRTLPHVGHYSGDPTKRVNVVSCCNCGRKGHDAQTCRDPNPVEVFGKDFHLKMSQPQHSQGK